MLTAEERREVVAKTSEAPSKRKQKCDTLLESLKRECDECDSGYLQSFGIEFGAPVLLTLAARSAVCNAQCYHEYTMQCRRTSATGRPEAASNGGGLWQWHHQA